MLKEVRPATSPYLVISPNRAVPTECKAEILSSSVTSSTLSGTGNVAKKRRWERLEKGNKEFSELSGYTQLMGRAFGTTLREFRELMACVSCSRAGNPTEN